MSLVDKFKEVFDKEVELLGLKVDSIDNVLTAKNDNLYMELKARHEYFANSKVAFAELLIVRGDTENINHEDLFSNKDEYKFTKVLNKFDVNTNVEIDSELDDLKSLKSLETKFLKSDDCTAIYQKGTYDLILESPLSIDFLRGKMSINELFTTIDNLAIPNGLYLQQPKGLGKDKNVRLYKILGWISFILFLLAILFSMILNG